MIHKNVAGRGIHQPGQYQVINETPNIISKMTVVQVIGMNGLLSIAPVDNPTTNDILGVVTDDIVAGAQGYVARLGLFGQFDTTPFSHGDTLYSDSSGQLTTVELGPNIARVRNINASNGHLQVDVYEAAQGGGSDGHFVLNTMVLQTDIDNGYINLPVAPGTPSATIVLLKGAPAQVYNEDFTVTSNQLNFINTDPGDLGNILTAGDKITVMYK